MWHEHEQHKMINTVTDCKHAVFHTSVIVSEQAFVDKC